MNGESITRERELEHGGQPLSVISRAEIDIQISTAHAYPRSIEKFKSKAMSMLTLNKETAVECFYVLKRKDKAGDEVRIEGASVRLAEIIAGSYGNLRVGGRVVDEGDRYISAQGICHDLENNLAVTMEVRRRITSRDGRRYSDDMITVTGNAATAIAFRNAVLRVVPKALWLPLFEQARLIARGDEKTLEARREIALKSFEGKGVKRQQVFDLLKVKGAQDITLDLHLELVGIWNAIQHGDTSIEETFGTGKQEVKQPQAIAPETQAAGAKKEKKAKGKASEKSPSNEEAKQEKAAEPAGDPVATEADLQEFWKAIYARGWSQMDVKAVLKADYNLESIKGVTKQTLETIKGDILNRKR